jgi:hypothetical protein
MKVPEFQARWRATSFTEKAAAQSHFLDVCELVGHKKPAELDPAGAFFTFEKNLGKTGGGAGFADVWCRGHFAWEYKRPEQTEKVVMKNAPAQFGSIVARTEACGVAPESSRGGLTITGSPTVRWETWLPATARRALEFDRFTVEPTGLRAKDRIETAKEFVD